MCFIADGIADIYRTKPTIARKNHRCNECGRTVKPGEQYLYHFQVYEGEALTRRVCRGCAYVRQLIHDAAISAGCAEHESWPLFGNLYDDIQDYPELARLWTEPAPAEFQITESW